MQLKFPTMILLPVLHVCSRGCLGVSLVVSALEDCGCLAAVHVDVHIPYSANISWAINFSDLLKF